MQFIIIPSKRWRLKQRGTFRPAHLKWDQNSRFAFANETRSIPTLSYKSFLSHTQLLKAISVAKVWNVTHSILGNAEKRLSKKGLGSISAALSCLGLKRDNINNNLKHQCNLLWNLVSSFFIQKHDALSMLYFNKHVSAHPYFCQFHCGPLWIQHSLRQNINSEKAQ